MSVLQAWIRLNGSEIQVEHRILQEITKIEQAENI
jgi:hypothetical protein